MFPAQVSSLGKAYKVYAKAFVDNGVSGSVLLASRDDELDSYFDVLGITNVIHCKAIREHLKTLRMAYSLPEDKYVANVSYFVPENSSPSSKGGMDYLQERYSPEKYYFKVIMKYYCSDCFLTHDWGTNEDGTSNHALVLLSCVYTI